MPCHYVYKIASQSKIGQLTELRSKRIRVFGWVHRLRQQKDIIFLVVRDGTGYLQTVLSGTVVRRLDKIVIIISVNPISSEPDISGPDSYSRIIYRARGYTASRPRG